MFPHFSYKARLFKKENRAFAFKSHFRTSDTDILARAASDDTIDNRNFMPVYFCDISQMFRKLALLSNLTLVVQFFCSRLNHIPDFTVWELRVQVFFYPFGLQLMLISSQKGSMDPAGFFIAIAPFLKLPAMPEI